MPLRRGSAARPTADSRGSSSESVPYLRETGGRPGWPRRTFQVQTNRNPLQCQAITVSGFTMTRADRQPAQNRDNRAQRNRSAAVSFGRFTERCKTLS